MHLFKASLAGEYYRTCFHLLFYSKLLRYFRPHFTRDIWLLSPCRQDTLIFLAVVFPPPSSCSLRSITLAPPFRKHKIGQLLMFAWGHTAVSVPHNQSMHALINMVSGKKSKEKILLSWHVPVDRKNWVGTENYTRGRRLLYTTLHDVSGKCYCNVVKCRRSRFWWETEF